MHHACRRIMLLLMHGVASRNAYSVQFDVYLCLRFGATYVADSRDACRLDFLTAQTFNWREAVLLTAACNCKLR